MLNFDVTLKVKAGTAEIRNNKRYLNGKETHWMARIAKEGESLSLHELNSLIKVYRAKWEAVTMKYVASLKPFKTLVKELDYFCEAYDLLVSMKRECLSSHRSKTLEKFEEEIRPIRSRVISAVVSRKDLSKVERILLEHKTGSGFHSYIEWSGMYNPATDTDTAEAYLAELKSFPWDDFGLSADEVLKEQYEEVEEHKDNVTKFRLIRDQAGADLPNWGQSKITIRLRKNGDKDASYYNISQWITPYCEHLAEQGIMPDPTKMTKVQLLQDSLKKGEKIEQAGLLSLFKQGNTTDADKAIDGMDVTTLKQLVSLSGKGVNERLDDMATKVVMRFSAKVETQEDHNALMRFTQMRKAWVALDAEYIVKHKDKLNEEDVVNFGRNMKVCPTPQQFKVMASKINPEMRYLINPVVTRMYLEKEDEDSRIKFLKRITEETIHGEQKYVESTQSVGYLTELEEEDKIRLCLNDLNALFKTLDYRKVRPLMRAKPSLMAHMIDAIIENKDTKSAVDNLVDNDLRSEDAIKMFNILPLQDKLKVIEQVEHHYPMENGAFKVEELPAALEVVLGHDEWAVSSIYTFAKRKHLNPAVLNEIVRKHKQPKMPTSESVIKMLDNETKKHLFRVGYMEAKRDNNYYYRSDGYDNEKAVFFSSFTREDLNELGVEITTSQHRLYLYHAMTKEERHLVAAKDKKFMRHYATQLGKSFFMKFEGEQLKNIFGDLHFKDNRAFRDQVNQILGTQAKEA